VTATGGWRKLTWGFNSLGYDRVRLTPGRGVRAADSGWTISIEEVALLNPAAGAPELRSKCAARDGTVYQEEGLRARGRPQLTFRYDHDAPAVAILPGGRIEDGAGAVS
jgi:hypothetical protein